MALEITAPDGSALPAESLTAERAIPSDHLAMAITNNGLTAVSGAKVVMYGEVVAGDWASTGHPVLDELMGRFQITSTDSSGTPGQTSGTVTPQPLGHLTRADLPEILPGNTIFFDFWIEQPGSSAGGGGIKTKLSLDLDSAAVAIEYGLGLVARGIASGVNLPKSYLLSGRALTPSGTPDDQVNYAPGSWLFQGVEGTDLVGGSVTLDQDDAASATLAAGEGYRAAISQGASSTPTVTKGLLASMTGSGPDFPAVPTGEGLLGFVLVLYGATGSAIAGADITEDDLTYYRFAIETSGLTATIHAGEAIVGNYRQIRAVKGTKALNATATNRVWLEYSGAITVTTTAAQPSPGALLLGTFTTDGAGVTSSTDDRIYLGGAGVLSLHASTHATAGTDPIPPGSIGAATVADLALKAPLAGPVFTGDPTAPTPSDGDSSTSIATTAFVARAVAEALAWEPVVEFPGDSVNQPPALTPHPVSDSLFVFKDGILQVEGVGKNYTYDPATGLVTHTPILGTGETGVYRFVGPGGSSSSALSRVTEVSLTAPNGVLLAFQFSNTIVDLDWIAINGQIQDPADFSVATDTVTFGGSVPPPLTGDKVVAGYYF